MDLINENKRRLKQENKQRFDYLKDKDQQRQNLIYEIKDAIQEDIEQKKEISLLKKKDQVENLERGKNFHLLYK
jgi:predicted DNA-binding protein